MPNRMRGTSGRSGKAAAGSEPHPLVDLRGTLIQLRAFRADEIDAAWRGLALQDEAAHPRHRPEDHNPQASEQFRRRHLRSGRQWRGWLNLAVDHDGRLIGTIQARTRPAQTLPAGVYEIGVVLYQPQDRGQGYGAQAVELLTAWLFETGQAERVQAGTEAGNMAMRTVLERLGFQHEGIMRGYGAASDGARIDGAMYAVLKPDWLRAADQGRNRLKAADPAIELRTVPCATSVREVIDHLAEAVTSAGLTVFGRIDHSANAAEAGLDLRPTELLIFGNPRAGTTLMLDQQTAGIDLPFKALAWADETGQVWLSYPEPASLGRRHNLSQRSKPVLDAIRDGMSGLLKDVVDASLK
jgi:uncharacterized protein (DUF302 family)/RimJ/RimL family protein N-acetyltransferase